MIKIFKEDSFDDEVYKSENPVLVDFYADWCGPCKMMSPIVDQIAEEYDGKILVGKCNIDENMKIAQKHKILSIPTLLLFNQGEVVETLVGARTKNELKEVLKNYL
ncbi:MAG: thioredoxin [Lachnospiraceae bacterium]|nr:thioredoxin [Lachnospiraceae bacterium]